MKAPTFQKPKGGWSIGGDDLKRELEREEAFFHQFENKKVRLSFTAQVDFAHASGNKIGRIRRGKDGRFKFYEGRKRTRYYNLTLGLFDGCYAMLVVKEVEPL